MKEGTSPTPSERGHRPSSGRRGCRRRHAAGAASPRAPARGGGASALHRSTPSKNDEETTTTTTTEEAEAGTTPVASSDGTILGVGGVSAALLTLWSEYTLRTTGCGLPAGPFGLVGLAEGLGYLTVTGIAGWSVVTRVQTGGRGLPGRLLGTAEGLSLLAVGVGLVVLVFQIADYGYVPNAVPMEGGMCS